METFTVRGLDASMNSVTIDVDAASVEDAHRQARELCHIVNGVSAKAGAEPQELAAEAPPTGLTKRKRKATFIGKGTPVQLLAVVFFFVPGGIVGIGLAIVTFLIGSTLSFVWKCESCGRAMKSKDVAHCPSCNKTFVG